MRKEATMCQHHVDEVEIYTPSQLAALDPQRIPFHLAFIPDGNRRWAKKNNASASQGHRAGADNLISTVKAAKALGVKVVTFYSLSTENWSRDTLELRALLWLLEVYLSEQCQTMIDSGIRFETIGDLSRFPRSVLKTIEATKEATAHCAEVEMVLALNYGSRDEMKRAVQSLLKDYTEKKFNLDEISESLITSYLDTAPWSDPDLLIRTSGEQRLSNFLLWQCSYAEIYIAKMLWPDFTQMDLYEAILEFQKRERRLGKV